MKNLHIMFNEKFILSYIKFINNKFNEKDHKFCIINGLPKEKMPIPNYSNVEYIRFLNEKNIFFKILKEIIPLYYILFQRLKKSEQIYFHGLFDKKIILFLFIFRIFLKKSNWIIWGGDLYCYEERRKGLKFFLWYKIENYVKRNFAYINTLVPQDYEIAKKYYNVKGKYKKAQYILNNNEIEPLCRMQDSKFINALIPEKKEEIYIQIGNSANSSNNHFEILDMLKKFKNEKIKIFCILSYAGNKSYVLKVNEYGIKHFGNKFIGIFDFIPINEYWSYLQNIDILIFNQKRQQGLGNIFMLSYFEKKIYLRNDISSWPYLVDELKLKINSYENIKNETFEEFIKNNSNGNKDKILSTVYSDKYVKNIWEDNFNN